MGRVQVRGTNGNQIIMDKLSKEKRENLFKMMAKNLPLDVYTYKERYKITGQDVELIGVENIEFEIPPDILEQMKEEPEKEFNLTGGAVHDKNHLRRIRRAYKRSGKKGVIAYIKPYLKPEQVERGIKMIEAIQI